MGGDVGVERAGMMSKMVRGGNVGGECEQGMCVLEGGVWESWAGYKGEGGGWVDVGIRWVKDVGMLLKGGCIVCACGRKMGAWCVPVVVWWVHGACLL